MSGDKPTTTWKVRVDLDVAAKVEMIFMDPLTRKPEYGARSRLITKLLREWVEQRGFDFKAEVERLKEKEPS